MPKSLPVALVYGDSESSQVLRHALGEIGAELVCDADIGSFNVDSLGASGADVVLISLDATIEARLDEIYGALDEDRYRVMFDDPEISNELAGWEHARWQRHLAAKLRDITDWDPPRPEGSAPVEVHARQNETTADDAAAEEWMNDALAVLGDPDSDTGEAGSEEPQADMAEVDVAGTASSQPGFAEPEPPEPKPPESAFEEPAPTNSELDEPAPGEPEVAAPNVAESSTPATSKDERPAETATHVPVDDVRQQLVETTAEIPPAEPEAAVRTPDLNDLEAMDDAALQAELDALADADDPLAALSAMAGEQTHSIEGSSSESAQTEDAAESWDIAAAESAEEEAPDANELKQVSPDALESGSPLERVEPEPRQAQSDVAATANLPDSNDASSAGDDDAADWTSLEAELTSAFDSETLGAIDEAGNADDTDLPAAPAWELSSDQDSAEPETSRTNEAEPQPAASATADNAATQTEPQSATEAAPPGDTPDVQAAASTGDTALPDVSQWALVEDDEMLEEESVEDEESASVEQSEREQAPAGKEPAPEDDDDDDDFGLALVDPIDYLKPEAPKDVSNELFNMPTLMPMAEAVAPKVGDEDEDEDESTGAPARIERVVVLGASIGGPDAVREFLSHLPQQLPASLILVQHLGSEFVDLMVSQLSKSSALPVRIPSRAERVVHGEVLVVPSGSQLKLSADGQAEVRDQDGAADTHPSINLTMSMAAEVFGAKATAIIFSGMASDAAVGALEIASRGGEVWVQDPDSCVVSNMVDEVVAAGVARFTGTPEALANKLVAFLQETDND